MRQQPGHWAAPSVLWRSFFQNIPARKESTHCGHHAPDSTIPCSLFESQDCQNQSLAKPLQENLPKLPAWFLSRAPVFFTEIRSLQDSSVVSQGRIPGNLVCTQPSSINWASTTDCWTISTWDVPSDSPIPMARVPKSWTNC